VTIAFHPGEATISRREDLLNEYDFIIVGAGTAGLTVGDRLSESGKFSVLVVEYGYNDTSSSIRSVANAYTVLADFPPDPDATPDEFPAATRMYNTTTVPLSALNNRTQVVPAGAVVGGSSAVNGMAFDRGSAEDYDAWVLAAGEEHREEYATEWGWENILPMFKKSVTFQPPTPFMVENYNMTSDVAAAYGGHTAIHSSYPPFQWPGLFPTRKAIGTIPGVEFPIEGADGNAVGVFFFPESIVPNIRKRSYALSGHYLDKDGPVTRDNFHLLPAHRVTQVLLSQLQHTGEEPLWQAQAVTITPRDGPMPKDPLQIKARREIIISAGSLHTPQVLQRSGIGPRKVLEAANVPVKIELPGVGENLQDHPFFAVNFNCEST
jgi:choline dehydrogenase-like flavoprotein